MSRHQAQYRPMRWRSRDLWSVGCTCGWLCSAPIKGEQESARTVWRVHRDEAEMDALTRTMTHVPRGIKGDFQ